MSLYSEPTGPKNVFLRVFPSFVFTVKKAQKSNKIVNCFSVIDYASERFDSILFVLY